MAWRVLGQAGLIIGRHVLFMAKRRNGNNARDGKRKEGSAIK